MAVKAGKASVKVSALTDRVKRMANEVEKFATRMTPRCISLNLSLLQFGSWRNA